MATKKKPKQLEMPLGTWQEISARVTELTGDEALDLLRREARSSNPRPYMMKRLYHRWRRVSSTEDAVLLAQGKLPEYMR